MREIDKLRRRLKNVERNVTEYRMTVDEARALMKEIEELLKPVVVEKVVQPVPPIIRKIIMDGGKF